MDIINIYTERDKLSILQVNLSKFFSLAQDQEKIYSISFDNEFQRDVCTVQKPRGMWTLFYLRLLLGFSHNSGQN